MTEEEKLKLATLELELNSLRQELYLLQSYVDKVVRVLRTKEDKELGV